jgi:hypothetical protein
MALLSSLKNVSTIDIYTVHISMVSAATPGARRTNVALRRPDFEVANRIYAGQSCNGRFGVACIDYADVMTNPLRLFSVGRVQCH